MDSDQTRGHEEATRCTDPKIVALANATLFQLRGPPEFERRLSKLQLENRGAEAASTRVGCGRE